MPGIRIGLSESINPRYLHITEDNVVHLIVSLIGADQCDGIDSPVGTDNTCKSAVALQQFFGLAPDSAQKQNSALHQLMKYKKQLEDNVRTLTQYGQAVDKVRSRIEQVNNYIDVLTTIRNSALYRNELESLGVNAAFPVFPVAFQNLLKQPNSNLYGIRLKPQNEDFATRIEFPLFSLKRSGLHGQPTPFYNTLIAKLRGAQNRDGSYNLSGVPPIELFSHSLAEQLLRQRPSQIDLVDKLTPLLNQNSNAFSPAGATFTRELVQEVVDYTEFEEDGNFSIDTLTTCIKNVFSYFQGQNETYIFNLNLADSISPFTSINIEKSPSDRPDRANILTQLLFGEINIYAQKKRLLTSNRFNMGELLDGDARLANELATQIARALGNNGSVEDCIFKVVNDNLRSFRLSRKLTEAEIKEIRKIFNTHSEKLKNALHMDEGVVLDASIENNASFFFHQQSIGCDFTVLLKTPEFMGLYNPRKFDQAFAQVSQMPVVLPVREESKVSAITLSVDHIKTMITRAISTNNFDELKKLLLKADNQYLFQLLGVSFFSNYQENPQAQTLFRRLLSTVTDRAQLDLFNNIVLTQRTQLILTPEMARSIYSAVQDRMELSVTRVLQYSTPDNIKALINDLLTLSTKQTNLTPDEVVFRRQLSQLQARDCKITQGSDGLLIIEAPQQTLDRLKEITRSYRNTVHLSMTMTASIYKQVKENYGVTHAEYQAMMRLNNNVPGDPTPYKFIKALELLGINIPLNHIRYNNTKNDLPYLTETNKDDKQIKRKGGSGFIVDQMSPENMRRIEAITRYQADKFPLPERVENALYTQVNQLCRENLLEQNYPQRSQRIEAALILLGIKYRAIQYDTTLNQFIVYLEQKEQSKIKHINQAVNHEDDSGLIYNNEDREFNKDYSPSLISPNADQGTLANLVDNILRGGVSAYDVSMSRRSSEQASVVDQEDRDQRSLLLTPDMLRSIYVAVQDRISLPVDRILHYLTTDSVMQLLQELHHSGLTDKTNSKGFDAIQGVTVTAAANRSVKIRGPKAAIEVIEKIIETYKNSLHLAMMMSSGLYKEVEEKLGSNDPRFKQMMQLNNNVLGDPTPYKLIEAFRLLGIQIPNKKAGETKEPVRYNRTVNALEYKTQANQNDGKEKKGGSGFVIDNLSREDLWKIEEITERQAYRMVLDGFFEIGIYDMIEQSRNHEAQRLLDSFDDRRLKLETALLLLGIQCRRIELDTQQDRFFIQTDQNEQSKIKKILNSAFPQIHHSILLFNTDDQQRSKDYNPRVIQIPAESRSMSLAEYINQRKLQQIQISYPLVLPYRHSVTPAHVEGAILHASSDAPPFERVVMPASQATTLSSINRMVDPVSERTTHHASPTTVREIAINEPSQTLPHPAPGPLVTRSQDILLIERIIYELLQNILRKRGGRASWFGLNTADKVDKLNAVLTYLNHHNVLELHTKKAVLTLLRDICSIKRNPIGFFAPHSLAEFDTAFENVKNLLNIQTIGKGDYGNNSLLKLNQENVDSYISSMQL